MTSLLADVVGEARLSTAAGRRRQFTVDHHEAVLALRARPRPPWAFCVDLLRAAGALSPGAIASARAEGEGGATVVFDFVVPDVDWAGIDVAGLLSASLAADAGDEAPEVSWRRLVGRAINAALGQAFVWVELLTPVGGRRWDRIDAPAGADPYAERLRTDAPTPHTFAVRVRQPERNFVRKLWSSGSRSLDDVAQHWSRALGRAVEDPADGVRVRPDVPRAWTELGGYARFAPEPGADALLLQRHGVIVAPVRAPGLEDPRLRGRVECSALSLDIDDAAVVADGKLDLLVAWLLDEGEDSPPDVTRYVSGPVDEPEVLFAWKHQATSGSPRSHIPVLGVTPSQLVRLRAQHPDTVFVPAAMLGAAGSARADLTALEQGSYGPISIPSAAVQLDDGTELALRIRAFVHRYAPAKAGAIKLLAWRRIVRHESVAERVVPGVTIVAEFEAGAELGPMTSNDVILDAAVEHARAATLAAEDRLLEVAMHEAGASPWSVPLLGARLEALDSAAAGLHFQAAGSSIRLGWEDSPLLRVGVGQERDGTTRTLAEALARARDVGGVVLGEELKRWYTLESTEPELTAWVPSEPGRALLHRVLGPLLLWEMPIVPEGQPQPRPAAAQPQLVLSRDDVERKLAQRAIDGRAREQLLAHALVTRARGGDAHGLDHVALLLRYDPRALSPRRRVSLASILSRGPRKVAPVGAVGRWLQRPVLEVTPAIASLLAETVGVQPAEREGDTAVAPSRPARRAPRRLDPAAPLSRVPVADPLCAGALYLVDGPSDGIELWAAGLRVGAFRLPSPLRAVAGRLWLTDQGIAAGHAGIVKIALERGRVLAERAVVALAMSPPRSARREALAAFVQTVAAHSRLRDDHLDLGELVGVEPRTAPREPAEPMRALPAPNERLQAVLRYVTGRPLQIETAWLSWRAVKVEDPTPPGRIELGLRHRGVAAALAPDAPLPQVWSAAVLVAAIVLQGAPELASADDVFARLLASARRLG